MLRLRGLVGFGKEWVASDDKRIVEIFGSMFEDTSIRSWSGSGVELYQRFHNWHGRGEDAYDDYDDTTLAYYDLKEAQDDTRVSMLLSRLIYDGAVTVPISRHGELLRFLLRNESLLSFCSKDFFRESKLLRLFSDYDFTVSDDRQVFAISRREEIVARYDYNEIRSFINETMCSESVYPCCLNLFITKILIEHPGALISINDVKAFRYVMVNLNTLYQRREIAINLDHQIFEYDKGSYLQKMVVKSDKEGSMRNMVQPSFANTEALLLDCM